VLRRELAEVLGVDIPLMFGEASPTGGADQDESRGKVSRDFRRSGLSFGPLKGTVEEGRLVADLLEVVPWTGADVLDSRVKAHPSPLILHVATHGFFLPDQPRGPHEANEQNAKGEAATQVRGKESPLLRSGLALAGAQTFLEGGLVPDEAEDGIMTAEDISRLYLMGTALVVLSACETGLGGVKRGEGVFGFRRSFVIAGAETLVMALWKVHDDATRSLMVDFYRRLLAGEARS